MVVVLAIVLLMIYRNWRYEQELDSLLWKIDYKDIQIPDLPGASANQGKVTRVRPSCLSHTSIAHCCFSSFQLWPIG